MTGFEVLTKKIIKLGVDVVSWGTHPSPQLENRVLLDFPMSRDYLRGDLPLLTLPRPTPPQQPPNRRPVSSRAIHH